MQQLPSVLESLTRARGHDHRSEAYTPFKVLTENIIAKLGKVNPRKGGDVLYWLTNTVCIAAGEDEIGRLNCQMLAEVLHGFGEAYDSDIARNVI